MAWLMTMVRWCAAKRIRIEPYGLDIVLSFAALARSRLPQWSERIFVGNALTWMAPIRFDFVPNESRIRTTTSAARSRRTADAGHRCRGRRLIVGVYGNADPSVRASTTSCVAGASPSPEPSIGPTDPCQRGAHVLWIDAPARTMA